MSAGQGVVMKGVVLALGAGALSMVYGLAVATEPAHAEDMRAMHGDTTLAKVMLDRLERREADPEALTYWEGQAWLGGDLNKLWLKSDGHVVKGDTEEAAMEAYYSRAVAAYWDLQLGTRHDFALQGEPARNWAALGFKGLAPYKFDIDATLYAGAEGRTALHGKVEYDLLVTQRLVLMPELEANLYGKEDRQRGIGNGLANLDVGLRLRYELRREVAPYVGVVWRGKYGDTADLARLAGTPVDDTQGLLGVRAWW
ncbi:MAG TPA: copper resistance protein B [Gammaproteobacteria bacterium]